MSDLVLPNEGDGTQELVRYVLSFCELKDKVKFVLACRKPFYWDKKRGQGFVEPKHYHWITILLYAHNKKSDYCDACRKQFDDFVEKKSENKKVCDDIVRLFTFLQIDLKKAMVFAREIEKEEVVCFLKKQLKQVKRIVGSSDIFPPFLSAFKRISKREVLGEDDRDASINGLLFSMEGTLMSSYLSWSIDCNLKNAIKYFVDKMFKYHKTSKDYTTEYIYCLLGSCIFYRKDVYTSLPRVKFFMEELKVIERFKKECDWKRRFDEGGCLFLGKPFVHVFNEDFFSGKNTAITRYVLEKEPQVAYHPRVLGHLFSLEENIFEMHLVIAVGNQKVDRVRFLCQFVPYTSWFLNDFCSEERDEIREPIKQAYDRALAREKELS